MKKLYVLIFCFLLLSAILPLSAYALSAEQPDAIQKLIDDAVRVSGTPGISAAVISGDQASYFNSGQTGGSNGAVDEHTLYEIGSLSKAFTAAGILLLEEQELLSTADRIEDYLPWLHFTYQGETAAVTIRHFLNHTSGLSQRRSDFPRGGGADMLRKSVEPFIGAELEAEPGTSYVYHNVNYSILGLVIEAVSGQSYETFMQEQVFAPLGLRETFLSRSDATATGRMAVGHRHAFFATFPSDVPPYDGMKPAGFIISSAHDMARWMSVQLGLAENIPEIFTRVVENARQIDLNVSMAGDGQFYSSGWIIVPDDNLMGHSGQTPTFMSDVYLSPGQEQGVIFLANGINVDNGLSRDIMSALDGDLGRQYSMSPRQLSDIILSVFAVLIFVLAVTQLILGTRNFAKHRPELTKNKIVTTAVNVALMLVAFVLFFNYPKFIGGSWTYVIDWNPRSHTIFLFTVPFFFISSVWHAYTRPEKQKNRKESMQIKK